MIQIFWEAGAAIFSHMSEAVNVAAICRQVTPCAWFVKGDTYTIGLLSMRLAARS